MSYENDNIKKLLTITNNLESLAEKLVADSEDALNIELFGIVLDSAHKLRTSIRRMHAIRAEHEDEHYIGEKTGAASTGSSDSAFRPGSSKKN